MLKHVGPGLIITAAIVGSGELIVTPKLGAEVGFTLLWFIILGCLIKVFVQIELGRFAITNGMTTLEAMNSIPGPRFIVSWLLWIWLVMYVALVFQVAGILGGVANVFEVGGLNLSPQIVTTIGALSCSVLLVSGRYKIVEVLSTWMVGLFTLFTIFAVVALQRTEYAITGAQMVDGLSFGLPSNFTVAFAAFGIIGVGASELIYYPYWCLEKGYARHVGPQENSASWIARARGWIRVMGFDAWISFVVYTLATVAFYLLGAAVLHGKGLFVEDKDLIRTLSHMYQETFGKWGIWIFLIGAFNVLYSTAFVASASNARLLTDALALFKVLKYRDEMHRKRVLQICCAALPLASLVVVLFWTKPVQLVFVGALMQGVMLPFLGGAAIYFRFKRTRKELAPGKFWTTLTLIAGLSMAAVGIYQIKSEVQKLFKKPPTKQSLIDQKTYQVAHHRL